MARVVALLRGVNIGKRQLPMAAVRAGLEAAGCTDVATYVQSGNVVLTPPAGKGRSIGGWLETEISAIAGFEVPVVMRTSREMATVVAGNPYPGAGGKMLHVVFCSTKPRADLLAALDLDAVAPEHATLVGADLYMHLPDGMGRARLPVLIERASKGSGIVGTARNWNTVERLFQMVGEKVS